MFPSASGGGGGGDPNATTGNMLINISDKTNNDITFFKDFPSLNWDVLMLLTICRHPRPGQPFRFYPVKLDGSGLLPPSYVSLGHLAGTNPSLQKIFNELKLKNLENDNKDRSARDPRCIIITPLLTVNM